MGGRDPEELPSLLRRSKGVVGVTRVYGTVYDPGTVVHDLIRFRGPTGPSPGVDDAPTTTTRSVPSPTRPGR